VEAPRGGRFLADRRSSPLKKSRQAILPSLRKLERIPASTWRTSGGRRVHIQRASKAGRYLARCTWASFTAAGSSTSSGGTPSRSPSCRDEQGRRGEDVRRSLCRSRGAGSMVYAGDGENDAMAMKWVVRKGDGLRGGQRGDRPRCAVGPGPGHPCRGDPPLFGIREPTGRINA